MTRLKQISAVMLLLTLGFGIIPPESFHHHEESHVICKKGDIHVETKRFECELCKFVLPTLIQDAGEQNFILSTAHYFYTIKDTLSGVTTFFDIPNYRGPPEIA